MLAIHLEQPPSLTWFSRVSSAPTPLFPFSLLSTVRWLDHWEDLCHIPTVFLDNAEKDKTHRLPSRRTEEFRTCLHWGLLLCPSLQRKRWKNPTVENGSGACVSPPAATAAWAPARALARALSASRPWRRRDARSLATGRSSLEVSLTLRAYRFSPLVWKSSGIFLSNLFPRPVHVDVKLNTLFS